MSETSFFDFIGRLWDEHAATPALVLQQCEQGLTQITRPEHVTALAQLTTHVAGEHLGRWQDGLALLERLRAHALIAVQGAEWQAVSRSMAVLAHCAGDQGAAGQYERNAIGSLTGSASRDLSASERIRVLGPVVSALAGQRRTSEAVQRLEQLLALASYGPDQQDPASRTLAITGNNLAAALEEMPQRSPLETDLMVRAARLARQYWEVAGTWLEVERAEYRLAMTMIAAGDGAAAVHHAEICLDIVDDNQGVPYEFFYAYEVMARAQRAAGNVVGAKIARDRAAVYIDHIRQDSRASCREALASLDKYLQSAVS